MRIWTLLLAALAVLALAGCATEPGSDSTAQVDEGASASPPAEKDPPKPAPKPVANCVVNQFGNKLCDADGRAYCELSFGDGGLDPDDLASHKACRDLIPARYEEWKNAYWQRKVSTMVLDDDGSGSDEQKAMRARRELYKEGFWDTVDK